MLIITGGIAAYKALELIRLLRKSGAHVQAVLTKGGSQFVTSLSISSLTGTKTYMDLWDLNDENEMGHIRLSRENDLVLVAPATADIMAKMAHGLADDLASTTLLATDKSVMVAPAMNPMMWQNKATQANVETLAARGILLCGPNSGDMACGETGKGRMAEPAEILAAVTEFFCTRPAASSQNAAKQKRSDNHQDIAALPNALFTDQPLADMHAIVTSGPTHEAIDPVRFIGNHSSGKQGHAIAAAIAAAGARVTLVTGPVAIPAPDGVTSVIRVTSAREMYEAVSAALPADIAVCAAAVADWGVAKASPVKIKKTDDLVPPTITLVPNPDILKMLGTLPAAKRPAIVVGFAAETDTLTDNAAAKLDKKQCDIIVANKIDAASPVFGADHNTVQILEKSSDGRVSVENRPTADKQSVAAHIVACMIARLEKNAVRDKTDNRTKDAQKP